MVERNYLSVFLVTMLSFVSIAAGDQSELKEKLFDDCILREADGKIWLQKPMVYLGMWGVMATPPFCLSEDISTKLKPLISKINNGEGQEAKQLYTSEEILRKHKGSLILVSLNAKFKSVYDKEFKNVESINLSNRPDYYEIVEADLLSAELISADWIKAWCEIDRAIQEIVFESRTQVDEGKKERLTLIFGKGERASNMMFQTNQDEDFNILVRRIGPNSLVVRTFALTINYRWCEWLEKFSSRLNIKLNKPLPAKPKLWPVLEVLVNSESLAEFRLAKEKIPPENLKLLYNFDLGQKIRDLEIGRTKDYSFDSLRESAKEMLPEIREHEEQLNNKPESSKKEILKDFGLVVSPANDKLLTDNLILSGLKVESISDEHSNIELKSGDIIVNYERIYDVVMNWHSLGWQVQSLTGRIRQHRKLKVIREGKFIDLAVDNM
ncbi:MAG: hypothetical protein JW715_11615 [Sedimentisphaerales bacterium]|nr:hypothetical protein [Sedimentisphaerales bacterium]